MEADVPAPAVLEPEVVPFEVRYEDEHLAVVDKPPGVVVHPGAGRSGAGTLAAGILQHWPGVRGVGEEGPLGNRAPPRPGHLRAAGGGAEPGGLAARCGG